MKTEGQVRHKLKQVLFRHLKKRLDQNFKKSPNSCRFNRPTSLQGAFISPCHVCTHPENALTICDARYRGNQVAAECPYWQAILSKDDVKNEFTAMLKRPRGEVAAEYPDVAALLWVLDREGESVETIAEIDRGWFQEVENLPEHRTETLAPYQPSTWEAFKGWRHWPWNWGRL